MRKVVIDLQSKCYNTLFPFDFSFSFLYKYVCNERTDGYTRISVGRDETYKVELRKLPLACNRKLPLIPSLAVREKKVKKKKNLEIMEKKVLCCKQQRVLQGWKNVGVLLQVTHPV